MILNKLLQADKNRMSMVMDAKIEKDAKAPKKHLLKIIKTLHMLEFVLGVALSESEETPSPYYNNISHAYSTFLEGLEHIVAAFAAKDKPAHRLKFLDVGCGLGTKCMLAKEYGLIANGIDINSQYALVAANMGIEVQCINALEYPHYGLYDVIYWYLPIKDRPKQAQLEIKIFKGASPTAILYPASNYMPCCNEGNYNPMDDGWKRVEAGDAHYWIKG